MTAQILSPRPRQGGFTLLELAVVLIIVGLLSGGLMLSLSARLEAVARSETQSRLNEARDALLGFAAANGRLPCPAAPGGSGLESPEGGGACTHPWDGLLPAITLGLGTVDDKGRAIDAWGNPIGYAVSSPAGNAFSTANGIRSGWNATPPLTADLSVCSTAAGISGTGNTAQCASGNSLVKDAVAVIYSRGANGGRPPASDDEKANGDADRVFIHHTPTSAGPAGFDDQIVWISPNLLYYRLICGGRLP